MTPSPSGDPVVTLVAGRPGTPTPTEREAIYRTELRRGGPPPGWVADSAREWGISHSVVSRELAEQREALDAERQVDGTQKAAWELTMQAVDAANRIDALSTADLERDEDADRTGAEVAALVEARAKGVESRAKVIKMVADIKLRSAASLLAIHRKPSGPPNEPQSTGHVDPNTALKQR